MSEDKGSLSVIGVPSSASSGLDRGSGSKAQVWLTKEATEFVAALALLEGKRKQDVIADALKLLRWSIEEMANSRKVGSFDADGKDRSELFMPYSKESAQTVLSHLENISTEK